MAAVATAAWLWLCWCLFPLRDWNDVRLAPSLALARGVSFYPGLHSGAVTTWIYGPLPVLLWLPAALARTAAGAIEAAGAINLLITVAAVLAVCWMWPAPEGTTAGWRERGVATVLALAIWPFAAFQYLQADNVAVALGLLANLWLIRQPTRGGRWGAALLAMAGLACKQTSVGIAAAQIVWLAITVDRREAARHLGRCAAWGGLLAGGMAASFNWNGIWTNLVAVPEHLPWAPHPLARILHQAPALTIQLVVPALVLSLGRAKLWSRRSVLLLPSLAWLLALPLNAAAFLKFGGTLNSLQGFTFWLTPALVAGIALVRGRRQAHAWLAGATLAAAAICGLRYFRSSPRPLAPMVEQYREAKVFAAALRGRIWFPWNPLVTIYSEDRFYDVEDGITMRYLAGDPLSRRQAWRGLPSHLDVIALPRWQTTWGFALRFAPPKTKTKPFGLWTLHVWPPGRGVKRGIGRLQPSPRRFSAHA